MCVTFLLSDCDICDDIVVGQSPSEAARIRVEWLQQLHVALMCVWLLLWKSQAEGSASWTAQKVPDYV